MGGQDLVILFKIQDQFEYHDLIYYQGDATSMVHFVLGHRVKEFHGLIKIAFRFLNSMDSFRLPVGKVQILHSLIPVVTPSVMVSEQLVVFF